MTHAIDTATYAKLEKLLNLADTIDHDDIAEILESAVETENPDLCKLAQLMVGGLHTLRGYLPEYLERTMSNAEAGLE